MAPELVADADDPDIHLVETIDILNSTQVIDLDDQVISSLWRDYKEDDGSDCSSEEEADDVNEEEEDEGEL